MFQTTPPYHLSRAPRASRPRPRPHFQKLILRVRRVRRHLRPYRPVVLRFFIALFALPDLFQATTSAGIISSYVLIRLLLLIGTLSSILSIIFFDIKVFPMLYIITLSLSNIISMPNVPVLPAHLARLSFHLTPLLFSCLIGRRRCISRPLLFKPSTQASFEFFKQLKYVDILELGIRLQIAVLLMDYCLAKSIGLTVCFFAAPFAALYAAGFSTTKNGTVVLGLLTALTIIVEKSPILAFGKIASFACVAGGGLALLVGPGMITMDEWLERARQLCY